MLTFKKFCALPADEREEFGFDEVAITRAVRHDLCVRWQAFHDVEANSFHGWAVYAEAERDPALLAALTLPAADFADWLEVQDADSFVSTARTGSTAWHLSVVMKARAAAAAVKAAAEIEA